MPIKNGDKIKVEYTGTLEDGTTFDSSAGKEPLEFEVGSGQLIKGFDAAVVGMEKGEEKEIKLGPDEAYGQSNPQAIHKVPKDQMPPPPDGQELKAGMMLGVKTPEGQQIPAKVAEVTDTEVTIDMNHPLAGKTLTFKIKVIEIVA